MSWWLHRAGVLFLRVIFPSVTLLSAGFLLIYGFNQDGSQPDVLLIRVLGIGIAIGSILMLVAVNTRRARRRLDPFRSDSEENASDTPHGQ